MSRYHRFSINSSGFCYRTWYDKNMKTIYIILALGIFFSGIASAAEILRMQVINDGLYFDTIRNDDRNDLVYLMKNPALTGRVS